MVRAKCPKCAVKLNVSPKMAGRKGKCPKCEFAFAVPANIAKKNSETPEKEPDKQPLSSKQLDHKSANVASDRTLQRNATAGPANQPGSRTLAKSEAKPVGTVTPTAVPAKDPRFRSQLLKSLEEPIEPVHKSVLYPISLTLVTIVMVLLPVLYLGFIALVGYGVYYHLTVNQVLLTMGRGRGRILMVLVYLAPLIVGCIAVLFMLKPLFARPAKKPRTRSLTADAEPLLFAFVEKICDAVGAPEPSRIDVDCEVNASAGFRRGFASMLGGDLVLTIGMPLVAGLSLQQFAGVLAHEFGHFSQGVGMRLSYIIRSINRWFARVVYERDEWDEYLVSLTNDMDIRIGWVFGLAQICVVISRGVLWVLMMIGLFVSGVLLRQMEYDADRYEARLVGNDVFEQTSKRLTILGVSYAGAQQIAYDLFQRGTLADNFAEMTVHLSKNLPAEIRKSIAKQKESTGLLDSHPCNKDRIASVRREENDGIFHVDSKARHLFAHFDQTSKNVTWDFYCTVLGRVNKSQMVPVAEIFADAGKAETPELPPIAVDELQEETIPFDDD